MNGKQLKNSILQWAIQGKLVEQNPKDEPASKLLDRIAAQKAVVNGAKKSSSVIQASEPGPRSSSKKAKSSKVPISRIYRENGSWFEQVGSAEPKDITEEIPFDIPESWEWCRLGSICDYLHRGKSPTYSEKKVLPVMAQKCNQWDKIYTEKCLFADPKTIEKYLPEHFLKVGDVLINSTGGGTVGRTGFVDDYVFAEYKQFVADSHVTVVRSNERICSKYVYYYLITPYIQTGLEERCAGSTNQIELGTETVRNYLIPLSPFAEQKRIVAKLEQILPLVEEYDSAQQQLDKLNKELPEALKKSILQQAIQGKLVPQNPKDEPAQALLDRISAERAIASLPVGRQGGAKQSKKASAKVQNSRIYRDTDGLWYEQIGTSAPKDITEEIPFDIPENWTWCRLGSICDYLHRGKSPTYSEKKVLPVMAQKCNQWDKIYTDKCLFADPKTIEKYQQEHFLQVGDVLINSTGGGTVGRTGFVDNYVFSEYKQFVADSHVTVIRSNEHICSKYVYYYLITPYIQTGLEERCAGSTNQIELGTETIRNYLFPLPPLAEQKRIVAKLEQLFKVL